MKPFLTMMCLSFIVFSSQTICASQYPEPAAGSITPENKKAYPEPQIKPKNKNAFPGQDWKSKQQKKNDIPDHDWKSKQNKAAHPDFDWKTATKQKKSSPKSNPNDHTKHQIKSTQQRNKAVDSKPKLNQKGTKNTSPDGFEPESF